MNLPEFRAELQQKMHNNESNRPFICDGNPLTCTVWLVGINPATPMKDNFFDFFNKDGFDYGKWENAYKQERREMQKSEFSKTRIISNLIVKELKQKEITILETNVYATPTSRAAELKQEEKDSQIFTFLLDNAEVEYILVHGNEAIEEMNTVLGKEIHQKIVKGTTIHVVYKGKKIIIKAMNHLSYQLSHENAKKLAAEILANL